LRLYFHLISGTDVIFDKDGLEVTSLDDVRETITADIEELIGEFPADQRRGWRLEVTDESGTVYFSVPLNGPE